MISDLLEKGRYGNLKRRAEELRVWLPGTCMQKKLNISEEEGLYIAY